MGQAFFDFMKIHLAGRLTCNDHQIIMRMDIVFQLMKGLAQVALNLVALDRMSQLLADGKTDAEMLLLLFLHVIDDQLPVGEGLAPLENLLKFLVFLNSICFLHRTPSR